MTLLVTGAAGGVARMIRPMLLARYGQVRLSDRVDVGPLAEGETFVRADLNDADALAAACDGMTAVIHLGGQSTDADWATVDAANIQGCLSFFEAARRAGVARVVFASSNHAVGMYARTRKIGVNAPVRPDCSYGLSKAFGEALGALYADKHGLRVLSIRIGNVDPKPADVRRLSMWLHPEDLVQLCAIGIEHPDLHNEIVYGVSDCIRGFWDNGNAHRLGYRPAHRAEDHLDHAFGQQATLAANPVGDQLVGGDMAANNFDGDLDRTLWS